DHRAHGFRNGEHTEGLTQTQANENREAPRDEIFEASTRLTKGRARAANNRRKTRRIKPFAGIVAKPRVPEHNCDWYRRFFHRPSYRPMGANLGGDSGKKRQSTKSVGSSNAGSR